MKATQVGSFKCVILVCEEALEQLVGEDIIAAGAKGYTVSSVRGRGNRGVRDAQWNLSGNIRFEILCQEAAAWRLVERIESKYSLHYGLVIFVQDVQGTRADKY